MAALLVIAARLRPVLLGAALAFLLLGPSAARAQQVPADTTVIEDDAEAALDDLDTGAGDPEQLADLLLDLAENPLDVNTATADELALIPTVTPLVAQNVVAFRRQFGRFGSIPEVRSVEGVTETVFLGARPYLRIGAALDPVAGQPSPFPDVPSLRTVTGGLRFDVIQRYTRRLDLGRGYDAPQVRRVTTAGDTVFTTTYAGSPERLYTRLRAQYKRRVSLNLTLDKDPGEPFEWRPERQTFGYDHVSGHAAIRDFGRIRALVVGDFSAAFGQGLTLWRGYAFGKGRAPVRPIPRSGRGIVPYGSTEENRFFRGLAGTFRLTPDLSVSAFASRRALDATLVEIDTTDLSFDDPGVIGLGTQVSTLPESGLHRTATERARKDALRETLAGGALEYTFRRARVGVVGYHGRFDQPIAPGEQPYERFQFSGEAATMASVYANAFVGDFQFFGEAGRAPSGAVGGVGGLTADLSRTAEAIVLVRHYPRDFASLHGYAFGERNGATQNETGFYTGLTLDLSRRWTVAGYFDQYRFPWTRFGVPRPSSGYDARLVIEHEPRPWLSYYLQLRSETREVGADVPGPGARVLDGLAEETRQSVRLSGDYAFSRDLRLRARAEVTRFLEDAAAAQVGLLLYQDVRWRPTDWLQADARLAFFDTDGFDARVYAFENDLLYTFSVPAFSGKGQRAYVLLKVEPVEALDLQLKYGVTRFQDVETVGSGLDEAEGNRLREIRAQVRWTF